MNEDHPVRFSVDYPDRPLTADHRIPDLHGDPDRDRARRDRRLRGGGGYDGTAAARDVASAAPACCSSRRC